MSLLLEGQIEAGETKTFTAKTTRAEESPRLVVWVNPRRQQALYGKVAPDAWFSSFQAVKGLGLVLTSAVLGGREFHKDIEFGMLVNEDGLPSMRFPGNLAEGDEVSYTVTNRGKYPKDFAIDLHGRGGLGCFDPPTGISDAFWPIVKGHLAKCQDRRCRAGHTGEPLCPETTKIAELLRAETFLQRLALALEGNRAAQG